MLAIVNSKGMDGAVALYHQLKTAEPNGYHFSESELNGVGYALLGRRDTAPAITVFELNAQQFPTSSSAFDSLGEALAAAGRRDDAVKGLLARSRARSKQHQRASDAQEVGIARCRPISEFHHVLRVAGDGDDRRSGAVSRAQERRKRTPGCRG